MVGKVIPPRACGSVFLRIGGIARGELSENDDKALKQKNQAEGGAILECSEIGHGKFSSSGHRRYGSKFGILPGSHE
jgi:hypothetical protein